MYTPPPHTQAPIHTHIYTHINYILYSFFLYRVCCTRWLVRRCSFSIRRQLYTKFAIGLFSSMPLCECEMCWCIVLYFSLYRVCSMRWPVRRCPFSIRHQLYCVVLLLSLLSVCGRCSFGGLGCCVGVGGVVLCRCVRVWPVDLFTGSAPRAGSFSKVPFRYDARYIENCPSLSFHRCRCLSVRCVDILCYTFF